MSSIFPLVAEQQRCVRPFISHTKSGERVIVNPSLTTSRIYMVSSTFFFLLASPV
jgi:POT family proton-dependent oligopeptide transporter